ncbi:MAG: GntR family transcriptional regulator [Fimbriimonas sp.]|nr:GntR family transcriptional regulator [Fimbriimonas sp.]
MSECQAKSARGSYQRIFEDIKLQIDRGDLRPGDVLPTRAELAKHYATARATVDKAFSELVRSGIVISGSGRRTVVAVKRESEVQITTIGVLWNWTEEQEERGGDFLDVLFRGIREASSEFLLEVIFRRAPLHMWSEAIGGRSAQGLLVVRPDFADNAVIDAIQSSGIPVVLVPGALDESPAPTVAADSAGGCAAAIEHLTDLGHRDIGFVGLTATVPDHFERLAAFLRETGNRGITVHPEWIRIAHENKPTRFRDHLADWLSKDRHPSAVICSDFLMTLSVLGRLRDLGLSVPEDVSVVTFDDPAAAAQMNPSLTVVAQPIARLGYRSVQRLLECIAGKEVPPFDRLPTELIVRESTGPVCANRNRQSERANRDAS